MNIWLKFLILWLIVEVVIRLVDRFVGVDRKPLALTLMLSVAAFGMLWL